MKKTFVLGLSITLFLMVASCKKQEACSNACQNGGTCVNNSCNCTSGYEGASCQTKSNEKFIGSYTGSTNCDFSGNTPDTYIITAGANPLSIVLTETGGDPINATVSGNSISIPSQTTASGATVHGSGTLLGGNINLNVILEDGSGTAANCTFVGSK